MVNTMRKPQKWLKEIVHVVRELADKAINLLLEMSDFKETINSSTN